MRVCVSLCVDVCVKFHARMISWQSMCVCVWVWAPRCTVGQTSFSGNTPGLSGLFKKNNIIWIVYSRNTQIKMVENLIRVISLEHPFTALRRDQKTKSDLKLLTIGVSPLKESQRKTRFVPPCLLTNECLHTYKTLFTDGKEQLKVQG